MSMHTRRDDEPRRRAEDTELTAYDYARIALIRAQVERMDRRRERLDRIIGWCLGVVRRGKD